MKGVLVCGDAMTDRYWHGSIERISPEAPVPVVSVMRTEDRRGGAANVLQNLISLGASALACFSASYLADPVVKLRLIAGNHHVARIDFDQPQHPIQVDDFRNFLVDGIGIVVFSDYGKGSLANIGSLIQLAKREGKLVLVDPKARRYHEYAGADLLKPNLAELRLLVGGWSCEEELEHKVKALQRRAGIEAVLVTRGLGGMSLFAGAVTHIPATPVEVVDVSGAGDTALSAFAAAVARGLPYPEAARIANKAAGLAVGRFGTAIVTEAEVFG